ncbi:MAG TPA: YbgC/FadM family acyl-CoA thioesterase [Acetobacteraceae bacterium]|nr:YbgC/FadM family acyl-CoA thioesterase [Acetobacteraceae bacterium]
MRPSGAPHRFTIRVYYEDTDAGGVVYHASYLRFAERARTEALRAAGAPHSELARLHGLSFMVRRIELEYLAPARLDQAIVVTTETLTLGGASAELRQTFLDAGGSDAEEPGTAGAKGGGGTDPPAKRVLATARVALVCVRNRDGRPERIPQRWRQALSPHGEADGQPGDGAMKEEDKGRGSDG